MANSNWGKDDIPNLKGKIYIVTGATSGLGAETAKVLAGKNATVIMAVRNRQKAEKVASKIRQQFPSSTLDIQHLDLSSLESVQTFSEEILANYNRLDGLINNAGIMMCPYAKTKDGFEIQIGTNHFGHFALTGRLMPLLKQTAGSHISVTSSVAHRSGNIDFSDIHWEKREYSTGSAYGDSKLANLLFVKELARKLEGEPNSPKVTASHPGWTRTDLQRHSLFFRILNPFLSQTVENGVLPTLRSAVDPAAKSGDYFGPSRMMELWGPPVVVASSELSHDQAAAEQLWALSEELTGVRY